MKLVSFMVLVMSASLPAAEQEVKPAVPLRSAVEMPWVGLGVGPLDAAMRAHAKDVPERVGFLVTVVAEGGPAQQAGIQPYDILWKFDDQLLVNEAQFGVLISHQKPGDEVKLSLVRAGNEIEVKLKLMPLPKGQAKSGTSPAEIPLVPAGLPGMPTRIVNAQEKTAVMSREDGSTAKLRHEEGKALVTITDAEGELIYEGPVWKDGELLIPKSWGCSVYALMRTLKHADQRGWRPRAPRPRVVVPPSNTQKVTNR